MNYSILATILQTLEANDGKSLDTPVERLQVAHAIVEALDHEGLIEDEAD